MKFYIYEIRNRRTNTYYIGASTNPKRRFANHKSNIISGICGRYPDVNKDDLELRILEELDVKNRSEAFEREAIVSQEYVDNGYKLYNIKMGAHHTEEEKLAIGARHRGKHLSDEMKTKLRASHLGKKHRPESIAKMREKSSGKNNAMYGKFGKDHPAFKGGYKQKEYDSRSYHHGDPIPQDVIDRRKEGARKYYDTHKGARSGENNPMYGKKLSKERVESLHSALYAKWGNMKGVNNPFYGKKHSPETRAKMVERWKERRERMQVMKNNGNSGPLVIKLGKD